MKRLVLVLVLVALMLLAVAPMASAFSMPAVCAYAGYGPQWMTQCLVAVAMELWIDPLDLLD